MTEFEYLIVIISILYSLVLVRVVNGAVELFRSKSGHWIQTCWLLTVLQWVMLNWWLFWQFKDVEWTYGDFVLTILRPILTYYVVAVLVPQEPGDTDWREYFHANARSIFLGTAAIVALNNIINFVVRETDVFTAFNIFPAILIVLMLIASYSDARRLHGAITIATLVCYTMISLMFVFGGWFMEIPGNSA